MENMEIWGHFSIQSGKCSDEIVQILINAGFFVARIGCTRTETQFEILKRKETHNEN